MSLGKKVLGPRKVALAVFYYDDNGEVNRVFVDPAIDLDKSDFKSYFESHWDIKHLVVKENEKLTYFTIKPLTRRQKDHLSSFGDNKRQEANFMVRCSLTNVENYSVVNNNGDMVELPPPEIVDNGLLGPMITEKWLDDVDLRENHLLALQFMIKYISEAQPPL